MESLLNLQEETVGHFNEGARLVKAYTNNETFIITRSIESGDYWVTIEESNFQKVKVSKLDDYFKEVFGIEALY
jgi:hypothetical protein